MTQPEEQSAPKQQPGSAKELNAGDDAVVWDEEFERSPEVHSNCRCGECCRHLIIEVGLDDARREPKIKELGDPIYMPADLTESGNDELEGYLLNKIGGKDHACLFLDQPSNLCTIYDTRPWGCRVFDCDGEGKEQLLELGIRPGTSRAR